MVVKVLWYQIFKLLFKILHAKLDVEMRSMLVSIQPAELTDGSLIATLYIICNGNDWATSYEIRIHWYIGDTKMGQVWAGITFQLIL